MYEMKTLTIGENTYEIVDETARAEAALAVKTINGNAPDENGNVEVEGGSGGGDFGQYGLGVTSNVKSIPSTYALDSIRETGWYSIALSYGTVDFGDGYTANKFLLRVESGDCEQYTNVIKQTAMFSSYPGGEEYIRFCKNGYDWTAWEKVIHHPKNLTFKGAVNATYDGSEAVEVEIPQGGGGSGDKWVTIADIMLDEETSDISITTDINGNPFELRGLYIYVRCPSAPTADYLNLFRVYWYDSNGKSTTPLCTAGITKNQNYFEAMARIELTDNYSPVLATLMTRTGKNVDFKVPSQNGEFPTDQSMTGPIVKLSFSLGSIYPVGTMIKIFKTR